MRRGVVSGAVTVGLGLMLSGCALSNRGKPEPSLDLAQRPIQEGIASWYGPDFHGQPTASGEIYDQYALTAAHRTLPLGSRVVVTNLRNSHSVEVRVNDRGPFVGDRIIDLSYTAAHQLDLIGPGTAPVRIEVLGVRGGALPAAAYAVQVGAFANYENARSLQQSVRQQLDRVFISTHSEAGYQYYRVRIGPFAQRADAARTAERAAAMGLSPQVVENGVASQ